MKAKKGKNGKSGTATKKPLSGVTSDWECRWHGIVAPKRAGGKSTCPVCGTAVSLSTWTMRT